MHKFFTEEIDENVAVITGDDHKHLFKVLRLKVGDEVLVNDLKGIDFLGKITTIDKESTIVELKKRILENNESELSITLYQGLPKAGKMDLIVQKNTELGVTRIVPVITERVIVKNSSEYKKMDRLKRIILEASKQSKRSMIPEVMEPIEFKEAFPLMFSHDVLIVPYENAENYGLSKLKHEMPFIKSCGILVGPEGGFTDEEIKELEESGAKIVTLGKRILRTETAGFAAVTMLQLLYGDMGGE
ncbi:MAG: RsmE family RNA methyltransferase [Clostridiaceae bacterium]